MKNITLALFSVGSMFLFASCGGGSNQAANTESSTAAATTTETGEAIYKRTCFACHQLNGMGIANTFPPLAKSDFIADREKTIGQVIKGKSGELVVNGVKYNNVMPPQPLNDAEIAAVLTYVYSNFGNTGTPVTAEDVKAIRAKL